MLEDGFVFVTPTYVKLVTSLLSAKEINPHFIKKILKAAQLSGCIHPKFHTAALALYNGYNSYPERSKELYTTQVQTSIPLTPYSDLCILTAFEKLQDFDSVTTMITNRRKIFESNRNTIEKDATSFFVTYLMNCIPTPASRSIPFTDEELQWSLSTIDFCMTLYEEFDVLGIITQEERKAASFYSCMLLKLCQLGCVEQAMGLFRLMTEMNTEPRRLSRIEEAATVLLRMRKWDEANELMDYLWKVGDTRAMHLSEKSLMQITDKKRWRGKEVKEMMQELERRNWNVEQKYEMVVCREILMRGEDEDWFWDMMLSKEVPNSPPFVRAWLEMMSNVKRTKEGERKSSKSMEALKRKFTNKLGELSFLERNRGKGR
eukprot:TRINITY_DN23118_c0_g1_i1.p1 TRINITY_DN23118_c0_g1~~TRINITY_DN23118_c0_g1_i1.p1  ORF type:complete len:375 (+),score=75.49 TRINITY_DN23118_c0_g1_i1:403-1527(+)